MAQKYVNYKIIRKDSGEILQFDGNVLLEHNSIRETICVRLEDVASFFNFEVVEETANENVVVKEDYLPDNREYEEETSFAEESLVDDPSPSECFKWTDGQTRYMLSSYEENIYNMGQIGPMKRFRNKKNMWECVRQQCSTKFQQTLSIEQVIGRYKTVIRSAKNSIKNNRTSGAVRKELPYTQILNNFFLADDSLLPEIRAGPNRIERKVIRDEQSPSTSSSTPLHHLMPSPDTCLSDTEDYSDVPKTTPKKRQTSMQEKLVDKYIQDKRQRFEQKEENTKKRHEEKMRKIDDLFNILNNN